MRRKTEIDWQRLGLVAVLGAVGLGLVWMVLHYGPAETSEALAAALGSAIVLVVGAMRPWLRERAGSGSEPSARPLPEVLRDDADEDETPALGRRAQRPPPRRGGWSGIDAAIVIVCGAGLATVLAAALSGCGASELDHHTTAAVVMGRVHGIAEGAVDGAIHAAVAACYEAHRVDPEIVATEIEAAREACVAAVREQYGPGKTALAALKAALSLYRESIQLAAAAHGGDVMAALQGALRGVLEDAWPAALAALAGVGVELPPQVSAWVEVARSALLALLGGGGEES